MHKELHNIVELFIFNIIIYFHNSTHRDHLCRTRASSPPSDTVCILEKKGILSDNVGSNVSISIMLAAPATAIICYCDQLE